MLTTEERLTRLERKNRRLTLALVLTALAAGLVVTAGMGPAGPCRTRSRPTGSRCGRGRQDAGPPGSEQPGARPSSWFDAAGKPTGRLRNDQAGPRNPLTDEKGKPR